MKIIFIVIFVSSVLFSSVVHKTYNGETITIKVSKKSMNRLILPFKIKKKIYSSEKGLNITIDGTDAYIKYTPYKKDIISSKDGKDTQVIKSKIIYDGFVNAEVFLVTTNGTYSFIIKPKNIESRTIYVDDNRANVNNICKVENLQTEYIKRLKVFTKETISNKISNSFKEIKLHQFITKDFLLTDKYVGNQYTIYKIKAFSNTEDIKDILIKKLNINILAYTIYEDLIIVIGDNHDR